MKIQSILSMTIWISLLLVIPACTQEKGEQAKNVELTNAAWTAFSTGDFQGAITAADKCVQRFKGQADKDQADLQSKHVPLPPTGKVSAAEKQAIFRNGVLNDVATCYWIKGKSAQGLHRDDEARQAYKAAASYTYARTWDPKGWFWSPTEDASDRLQDLK